MNPKHFAKAAVTAFVLIVLFIAGLEYYWRSNGYQLSYNDDKMLWAKFRRQVYDPADRTTVFTGSSRIKWDIDIETWEKLTGEKAVQLGLVGTSPRKVILDLANDERFAGKLVIDAMETLFFSLDTTRPDLFAREALEYYYNETPAQRASAELDFALESKLVLLEEGKFGLNSILRNNSHSNRPGVMDPALPVRIESVITNSKRQNLFTPVLLNSPQLVQDQINRWEIRAKMNEGRIKIPKGDKLDSLAHQYKLAFDKIRARGGTVVLLRLPSSDSALAREKRRFPREQYWDRLIQLTNTPGIHYVDYPETAALVCLEGSHLSPDNAVKYTVSLVQTLSKEYGWKFPSNHP